MYKIITTFAFLFVVSISTIHAQQTHIVDLSGTGDFTSIHDAVDAAASGDTIRVQPDQYAFTADLGAVSVTKKIIIIGSGYMPVEDGGTELVDITGSGYFDLTGSADGTVIRGFRVQGATDFLDTESGTSGIIIEENLFINGTGVVNLAGNQDTVRSNIFYNTGDLTIQTSGTNTFINNNILSKNSHAGHNTGIIAVTNGSGVKVFNNMFLHFSYHTVYNGGAVYTAGSPEVYSNAFVAQSSPQRSMYHTGSAYVSNNAFYNGAELSGLNTVEGSPNFSGFDIDNEEFTLEVIDENQFDLTLTVGSDWIDAGRTGTLYLDTDGSRNDIGIYGGGFPFKDGRGAPTVPVVIDFQVSPTTVSPSGTITITATGRIGGN